MAQPRPTAFEIRRRALNPQNLRERRSIILMPKRHHSMKSKYWTIFIKKMRIENAGIRLLYHSYV
jgi:hypothetical protein